VEPSLSNRPGDDPGAAPNQQAREFTIDELAREAGTTVRNVRAYQDRGLIEPPERRGRVGIYGEQQLSRLRLINQLLARGYSLASIQELFTALEQGHDLHQILGLESAISSPWSAEAPRDFGIEELAELFQGALSAEVVEKIFELGLLEFENDHFHAKNPNIILAGAELVKAGIQFEDLLQVVADLRVNVERVTEDIVQLVAKQLDRYGNDLPPPEEMPQLADLIWRLRPLTMMAIDSEVSRALEQSASKFLGDRIAKILEQIQAHGGQFRSGGMPLNAHPSGDAQDSDS